MKSGSTPAVDGRGARNAGDVKVDAASTLWVKGRSLGGIQGDKYFRKDNSYQSKYR